MRKIIFALAFGVLLLPDYGFTLGLGEIEVNTALNQELNAEIELLSAVPEDVETLIVKLASREEFSRAGIDRPYLLSSLKFNAEVRDGVPIIRVTSSKPIREPFLNFLIEIDWPKGHMMSEYTILLDPPVFMGQQQAPADSEQTRPAAMESPSASPTTAPDPQGSSGFRPPALGAAGSSFSAAPVPVPTTQARAMPSPPTASAPAETSYQAPAGYRIQRGDTLWSLADSMRPDQSVSIEQTMLAMLRVNPEAFINENVNGLKRGYVLRIPDRDDIIAVSQADAIELVREQHALWREYQQAVTGGEPTSAMDLEAEADASAGFAEGDDARLEIVAAGSGVAAAGSKDPTEMSEFELRAQLAIVRESLETERVEKEEMQQRIVMLEGQVEKMKALLTLEDTDLAEMQQAAAPTEVEDLTVNEDFEQALVEQPEEALFDQDAMEEAIAEAGAPDEAASVVEEGGVEEPEQEVFADQEQVEATEQAEEPIEQPITSAEDFSVEPSTQPAFMQPERGPLSALLNNPVLLAAIGGGLLLVLMLIALVMRRRKGGDEMPVVASNLEDIGDQIEEDAVTENAQVQAADAVADEAVADVGTEPEKALHGSEETEDLAAAEQTVDTPPDEDAGTRDDVIAEADVYLAYGIYQQAEELLQNALKQNPDNDSYREKLAETYNSSKNTEAFIELATEVNERRQGKETPAWKKIVAVGVALCPEHALFRDKAADKVGDLSMDDLSSNQPESVDVDLGREAEQGAVAPELDLAVDESEVAAEPAESVEFDLAETGADTIVEDVIEESVEFDLSETGAETVVEEEEESVEFDLAETQMVEPSVDGDEEFSLDIEATELELDEEAESAERETDADTDFALDLSEEADAILAAAETTEEEFSLEDVDALGLDVTEEPDEQVAEANAEESLDEDASILDIDDMDLEQAIVESVVEPGIAGSAESASYDDIDDDELDLSDLDDIDEVGTKLDLAKAYLDMGDADGTRSILDEVMTEGDDTQKKEAEELLRQIG
ncbi:MAG: FimV/HubP family polar landmark protein [Gammaproteobacteria bacterium]